MTKKLFIFTLMGIYLLLASSCRHGDSIVMEKLDRVDSLMKVHPDSAYTLLETMREEAEQAGEAGRMRHLLLTADACNKLYRQMPSQEAFQPVVDYYDENGSPNERMKALYLMGCIYRDLGESPAAIEWYEKALEQADTLSEDCDYRTMMKICGQMANVFDAQIIPNRELEALEGYSKYALRCGDSCQYIRGIDLQSRSYWDMEDLDGVIRTEKKAAELYRKHGMDAQAAAVPTSTIYILLLRGRYEEAKCLMDDLENNSVLFDENGDIVHDRQHYYYSKGLYYTGTEQYDSAVYYFHKLEDAGFQRDSYDGLFKVYSKLHDNDSIYKYVSLYEKSCDDYIRSLKTTATSNVSSLYNYNRNKKLADQKAKEADDERRGKLRLVLVLLIVIITGVVGYVMYRRKKKREIIRFQEKYNNIKNRLKEAENDLLLAHDNFDELIAKKETEISSLKKELDIMGVVYDGKSESDFQKTKIYECFQQHKVIFPHYTCPTTKEWQELITTIKNYLPEFYHYVFVAYNFSQDEKKICTLLRMGFTSKEIQLILNKNNMQTVSNSKSKILKKLRKYHISGDLQDILSNWK